MTCGSGAQVVRRQVGCPTAKALRSGDARLVVRGDTAGERVVDAGIADLRFVSLIGAEAWALLPQQVRERFSKRLGPGDVALYKGAVTSMAMTRAGWMLAQALRIVGGPLPVSLKALGPAVVAVTEDAELGGQAWIRTYSRAGKFPQVVHSAKRFRGPTGLEEYVGYGIGMTLSVAVEGDALVFHSDRYFFEVGRLRAYLPRLLEPGHLCVTHRQESADTFSFRLTLRHALLGVILDQIALFRDVAA